MSVHWFLWYSECLTCLFWNHKTIQWGGVMWWCGERREWMILTVSFTWIEEDVCCLNLKQETMFVIVWIERTESGTMRAYCCVWLGVISTWETDTPTRWNNHWVSSRSETSYNHWMEWQEGVSVFPNSLFMRWERHTKEDMREVMVISEIHWLERKQGHDQQG